MSNEKQTSKRPKSDAVKKPKKDRPVGPGPSAVLHLQRTAGNRAVQRLLAQRQAAGDGFELDEATANRINQARGGGQPLDSTVQTQMSDSMGYDFSGVQVHTGSEADELNRQISARAFTTGQDIFFKQGEYSPTSSGGQELIAHELTHVVQQSSGRVGGGNGMTVRPAGDAFEQEADAMAHKAVSAGSEVGSSSADGSVQRQAEEEEIQTKPTQRQAEEEEIQTKPTQRQPEEEEIQTKPIQRQAEEEEEIQTKPIQRQGEEEEVQTKLIQRAFVADVLPTLVPSTFSIKTLQGVMSDSEIETFVNSVGTDRFKDLTTNKGVSADAILHYKANVAFLKDFIGAGTKTVDHIKDVDKIAQGQIKGCHDEDNFRKAISQTQVFEVNKKNSTGTKSKTMTIGEIQKETPLSKPAGVTNFEYKLRKNDKTGELRAKANLKTVIKGLATDPVKWANYANEAIWESIAAMRFDPATPQYTGVAKDGGKVAGYYNSGAQVDTFFIVE